MRWSNETDVDTLEKFTNSCFSVLLYLQYNTIICKADGAIYLSYKQTFWCFWLTLAILSAFVIIFCLILLVTLFFEVIQRISENVADKKTTTNIGSGFILTGVISSFICSFTFFLVNMFQYLDSNRKSRYNFVPHLFIIGWMILAILIISITKKRFAFVKEEFFVQANFIVFGSRTVRKLVL